MSRADARTGSEFKHLLIYHYKRAQATRVVIDALPFNVVAEVANISALAYPL
jgi:hypothetical protein